MEEIKEEKQPNQPVGCCHGWSKSFHSFHSVRILIIVVVLLLVFLLGVAAGGFHGRQRGFSGHSCGAKYQTNQRANFFNNNFRDSRMMGGRVLRNNINRFQQSGVNNGSNGITGTQTSPIVPRSSSTTPLK